MQNRNRILAGLILVTLMAVPLHAYQMALKDGQTIQFEKYRVTEKTVFYTDPDGKEIAIPLIDVDFDRTQELNAREPVPLNLPGLGITNGTELSVAEIARQQRKNKSESAAKRIYTDDDVVHGSPAPSTAQTARSEDAQANAEPAQKLVDKLTNKTQTQLADEVVGNIQFSGRDAWEQKLYAQGQRVIKFAQGYLDRSKNLDTIIDPAERRAAAEAAKNFQWQLNVEETAYAQVSADGVQKAEEWAKRPR